MSIAEQLKASIKTSQRERHIRAFNEGVARHDRAEIDFQKRRIVELGVQDLYRLVFPNARKVQR